MENKQTAVQWLIYTLQKPMLISESDFENIINQAIELEKHQIIDAFETAFIEAYKLPLDRDFNTAGHYYSETYNKTTE